MAKISREDQNSGYDGFHHYLPLPDTIFHGGIYVTSVGRSVIHKGGAYPPVPHPPTYQFNWNDGRTLPDFSFILITAGSGIFESKDTGRVEIQPGMVILLCPGRWHRYRPHKDTGWTEEWMQFNGEFVHLLADAQVLPTANAVFIPGNLDGTEASLRRLLDQIHAAPSTNSLLISLHAMSVLSSALKADDGFPSKAANLSLEVERDPLVAAARAFIWTSSHRVLSVDDVADAVGSNRRTLERHMSEDMGRGVLSEIVRCRFIRAERLLRETELPIKTIVSLAGFGSAENMRRLFMAEVSMSPREYREAKTHRPKGLRTEY